MKGLEALINPEKPMTDEDSADFSELFYQDLSLLQHQQRTAVPDNALSALYCEECGEEMPEQRRQAIKGVRLCVACKQVAEHNDRMYR